jgi:hypothetical protein
VRAHYFIRWLPDYCYHFAAGRSFWEKAFRAVNTALELMQENLGNHLSMLQYGFCYRFVTVYGGAES